jgi:RNA polymerase sigma-70 factor (ECF subfamily)
VDATDQVDIRASLKGDGDAYARLVRRHQPAMALRMRRFTRDTTALEELVQEVFVEAYFSLPRYKASAPFTHWLNRIATRVGYRFWKRRKDQPPTLALESWDSTAAADEPGQAQEAAEQLHALLAKLPSRDRLVITLLHLEEHSVAEAAKLAGWSQTMVKVQAFRARKKLRKLLEEQRTSHE